MRLSFFTNTLLALSLLCLSAQAAPTAWDPEKTHAVIVGVLSWQDTSIGTFASPDRQDRKFYETLLQRGVPADNVTLLLNQKATHQAILDALAEQLEATQPDETFVFYYAGHGVMRDNRILFVPYDFGVAPGLGMQELGALMTSELQGSQALLFADCCYSGGLAGVANQLDAKGIRAASLTSASDDVLSTSNWTFSEILIDCFNGLPAGDRDANGTVTMEEAASEVADAMRYHDGQEYGVTPRPWFSDLILATAPLVDRTLVEPFHRFDYVQYDKEAGKDYGRLTDYKNGNFLVEVQGYSERTALEVAPDHLRPVTPPAIVLTPDEAQQVASVDGKYGNLLQVIEVEPDYLEYTGLNDYGFHHACSYAGHDSLPEAYWVYVYPNWYLWGSQTKAPQTP